MYVCNVSQPQRLKLQLKLLLLPSILHLPLKPRNFGQLLDPMLVNGTDIHHKKSVVDFIPVDGGELPSHSPSIIYYTSLMIKSLSNQSDSSFLMIHRFRVNVWMDPQSDPAKIREVLAASERKDSPGCN